MSEKKELLVKTTLDLLSKKRKAELLDREADLLMEESNVIAILGLISFDKNSAKLVEDRLSDIKDRMEFISDEIKSIKEHAENVGKDDELMKMFKDRLN